MSSPVTMSLFDVRPVAIAREAEAVSLTNRASRQDGVLRTVTHSTGPFREVVEGATTGREYVVVELIDGRFMRQFADGRREALRINPQFVAYQVRIGVFVEVAA